MRQTHLDLFEQQMVLSLQLSTQDCIESIEHELLQLRNRKPEGVNRPKERQANVEIPEEAPTRKQVMRPEVVINHTKPPITRSAPTPPPAPVPAEATPVPAADNGPTHPFADAARALVALSRGSRASSRSHVGLQNHC